MSHCAVIIHRDCCVRRPRFFFNHTHTHPREGGWGVSGSRSQTLLSPPKLHFAEADNTTKLRRRPWCLYRILDRDAFFLFFFGHLCCCWGWQRLILLELSSIQQIGLLCFVLVVSSPIPSFLFREMKFFFFLVRKWNSMNKKI